MASDAVPDERTSRHELQTIGGIIRCANWHSYVSIVESSAVS